MSALRAQLVATRQSALALAAGIDAFLAAMDQTEAAIKNGQCLHPKDKRVDVSTMGEVGLWECLLCGFHGGKSDVAAVSETGEGG